MTDVYDVVANVGSGSMGEVSIVKKKQEASERIAERNASMHNEEDMQAIALDTVNSGKTRRRKYACKTINTVRFSDAEILEFINEIDILRDLDHRKSPSWQDVGFLSFTRCTHETRNSTSFSHFSKHSSAV